MNPIPLVYRETLIDLTPDLEEFFSIMNAVDLSGSNPFLSHHLFNNLSSMHIDLLTAILSDERWVPIETWLIRNLSTEGQDGEQVVNTIRERISSGS